MVAAGVAAGVAGAGAVAAADAVRIEAGLAAGGAAEQAARSRDRSRESVRFFFISSQEWRSVLGPFSASGVRDSRGENNTGKGSALPPSSKRPLPGGAKDLTLCA
jgi:hypothetical protein